jgi:hypothetical protein
LRGFERSHPQLVCVLIREMGSEARAVLAIGIPACSVPQSRINNSVR